MARPLVRSGCPSCAASSRGHVRGVACALAPDALVGALQMEAQYEQVGKAFIQHYYAAFDSNRAALADLYQAESMLSFEGSQVAGRDAIVAKLTSLPFQQVQHQVTSTDCHPTTNGGILVHVCGNLVVDQEGDKPPLKYSQTFVLMPLPGGTGWWVYNDIFRLNYG